jgi:hypothetical protein
MRLKQGLGFPLTRKRAGGFSEVLLASILALLLLRIFGLDSVELWRWYEFLKELYAIPIS